MTERKPPQAANDNHHDFYVYAWLRPNGEPFYVGKGRGYRAEREKTHNPIFVRVSEKIRRNGEEPRVVKWHSGIQECDAFKLERDYIKLFGRRDCKTGVLANLTDGGEGASGYRHTDESIRKISLTHKDKVVSAETRAKLGLAAIGRKTFLGRKHGVDAKRKISIARTGTVAGPIQLLAQSEAQRLRYSDPAEREAQSLRQIANWADEESRSRRLAAMQRPEVREKLRSAAKSRASTVEWKELMRGKNKTPEARAKNRDAQLSAPPKSKSGFKGIMRSGKKWRAKIVISGSAKCLGTFETPEEAARAYDAAAIAISEKAWLNFPAD